jgi:hypothetical protein
MKKIAFMLCIIGLFVIIAPSVALANTRVQFAVTASSADDFQPDKEVSITFEQEVTIKATTVNGARVSIMVRPDETLELQPEVYSVTVGASGRLVKPVALELGDNILEITVSREGYSPHRESHVIRRKDAQILQSLQNMLVIPGDK